MRRALAPLAFLALLAAACGGSGSKEQEPPKTPEETAERFLSLWKERKYTEMYDFVSSEAKLNIAGDKFVERYKAITEEATITDLDYQLKPSASPGGAEQAYSITLHTAFFGDIAGENSMSLIQEQIPQPTTSEDKAPQTRKEWRIKWQPSLVFKELDDRSLVHFFTRVPRRGGIYDRNGKELAVDGSVAVIGIVKDFITDPETTIARLTQASGLPEPEIRAKVQHNQPSYYFIPVKTLPYGSPPEEVQKYRDLVDLGVVVREETQRVYPNGASAAHVVGYMTEITEEQLKDLRPKGFEPGDTIGAFGLEGSMDSVLAGERGGLLATVTPEGSIARQIAEKPSVAGKDIQLTIDINVQKKTEAELGERVGSIVVMDPRDNAILALASFPRFDPNAFIRGLSAEEFSALSNDPRQPFLHRPLLATFPTGSVFKVVTLAAGLEKGGFSTSSTIHCPPLRIANAYSAISVTGVLRKPLLIRKISELGGTLSQDFQAEVVNPLPISPDTLDTIRQGLGLVIHSSGGTSVSAWAGSSVDAAGKSGTAEDIGFGANHVFFVAYANRSEPSILALAALETGESGSREAAPMIRNILEAYLGGALVNQP